MKTKKVILKLKKIIGGGSPFNHKSFHKPKKQKAKAIYQAQTTGWVGFPDEITIEVPEEQ